MITRTLKLKLTKAQEATIMGWLWNLTGVYNYAIRKIELDGIDKHYYSKHRFQNLLADHSKTLGIPAHVLQGTLLQAHTAWARCFKRLSGKPKLKGARNRLSSIPFPDPIKTPRDSNRILLPGLGLIKFHKQTLPLASIKCARLVHRASGWYLALVLDTDHTFKVKRTKKMVGIDPGFKTLLTLSDGTKFENPRELTSGAKRLTQAQKGNHKHLTGRLYERQKNRRNDRNHKISRKLVENYATICYSDDSFKGLQKKFGKSIGEVALGNLIGMLEYKSRIGGRHLVPVNSRYTTMTCHSCGALNGPRGLNGLKVRQWRCACGSVNDRDVNAALNVLSAGAGAAHDRVKRGFDLQESTGI